MCQATATSVCNRLWGLGLSSAERREGARGGGNDRSAIFAGKVGERAPFEASLRAVRETAVADADADAMMHMAGNPAGDRCEAAMRTVGKAVDVFFGSCGAKGVDKQ